MYYDMIFSKLPHELINYCIMPYAYNPKPRELLMDIRSFVSDFSLISSIYHTQYNDLILLNDLESIFNFIDENTNPTITRISFFKQKKKNTVRKNRLLWGLFTPSERTIFFNRYILDNLDEFD